MTIPWSVSCYSSYLPFRAPDAQRRHECVVGALKKERSAGVFLSSTAVETAWLPERDGVKIDQKPDGEKITLPVEVNEANFEQQIKNFIEISDYSTFDGQLHISLFRTFHGGETTIRILNAVLQEQSQPSIKISISHERELLSPFFIAQRNQHNSLEDKDFGYPGDRSILPR